MKICIIDDNLLHTQAIKKILYDNLTNISITHIDYPYIIDQEFDICFIDIDLKKENGIDIASCISLNYPLSKIVFIGEHNDLIFHTLHIQPFHFIRKDHLEKDFKTFFILLKKETIKHLKEFTLTNSFKVQINLYNILYLEVILHRLHIYTNPKQPFIIYKTLKAFLKENQTDYIIQVHKSYAVNLYHILKIENNLCYLKGNIIIPIGRKYYDVTIKKYMEVL